MLKTPKNSLKICWNMELWAVQKHVNFVDLVKSFPTNSLFYLLAKNSFDTAENEPLKVLYFRKPTYCIFVFWQYFQFSFWNFQKSAPRSGLGESAPRTCREPWPRFYEANLRWDAEAENEHEARLHPRLRFYRYGRCLHRYTGIPLDR